MHTKKFLSKTIIEGDIGAQETFHMLLKFPLVVCTRNFFPLYVGKKDIKNCILKTIKKHVQKHSFIHIATTQCFLNISI